MKPFTRRELAGLAIGSGFAAGLPAQTPSAPPSAPGDLLQRARDSKKEAAAELAKFGLAMSVEPAFQFKP